MRWAFALLLLVGCHSQQRERDAAVAADAGQKDAAQPPDAGFLDADAPDAEVNIWPARSCIKTIRYVAEPGDNEVSIAGNFSDWSLVPMRDEDQDRVFEITFSPTPRLQPGSLYAYKFVVDGGWLLDPNATHRKYDNACLNSAFVMPDCERPEIRTTEVHISADTATVAVRLYTAADHSALSSIAYQLDGLPIPTSSIAIVSSTVSLTLTSLAPGKHWLAIRAADEAGREASPVDLPIWIEETRFDWRDVTMYMILIDRFANGDRSIDEPTNVAYPADWHGGDLWGALEVLESGYFEALGVRAIWLSPVNQQVDGIYRGRGSDDHYYAAYHGYWPVAGRTVDRRFGGNEALRAFVEAAHRRGIRVLLDLINNQVHEQHEYVSSHPEWFRTGCVCGIDPGCDWSERPLDCLFAPYLPDINWREPGAERQFLEDAIFWITEFGIDGYRVDAVKHVETNSIYNLRAALAHRFEQGGTRIFLNGETAVTAGDSVDYDCGEIYNTGYAWIDAYTGENALDGQFDFPSHHRMQAGLMADTLSFSELEQIVSDAEANYRPGGIHVRFLGTHDSSRMATRANRNAAACCKWVTEPCDNGTSCDLMPEHSEDPILYQRLRRAFTILFTLPGIPFLYNGDEIALQGGSDPDNRRDMVWTDTLAHLSLGPTSTSTSQKDLHTWIQKLGRTRLEQVSLRRGRRLPLVAESTLYVYAYTGSGLVLVAVNRGDAIEHQIELSSETLGAITRFDPVVGTGTVTLDQTTLKLHLDAGDAAVFVGAP